MQVDPNGYMVIAGVTFSTDWVHGVDDEGRVAFKKRLSKVDPDGPLPPIPESNASKSGRERILELAEREKLTVRQLALAGRVI